MMASQLFRTSTRSNIFRQPKLANNIQKRNTGSSSAEKSNNEGFNRGGLGVAVGLSLGLGISGLLSNTIISKIFPSEPPVPVPEKVVATIDPAIIDTIRSQDRKINQLESLLSSLKDDIRDRNQQTIQASPAAASKPTGDVFELSQVIEANNLASESKHQRELDLQRKTLCRDNLLKIEGEVLKTQNKYRPVINKVKELESHLETQKKVLQQEAPARLLWISCQALLDRMRNSPLEPLEKDPAYDVLKQFAANNNSLAIRVLDSIPARALKEGIQSEEALIERFAKIEKICKRVALVGENGGGLTSHLVSYLQSLFILDNVKVTEDEVAGRQLVDPASWSTFDIVARVRYCLKEHNIEQAVRYANQLKGQARVVARDWIRDARVYLEARQAFTALSTHAEAVAVDGIRETYVE